VSDQFHPLPLPALLNLVLHGISNKNFMGIPESLFFKPGKHHPFGFNRYGNYLSNPLGVAAGPHTQLSQNIVAAWLCGARYIELKTIQTLDELEVSKPCIDMQDEGYNCEWSQELKVEQSFNEYLNAWIIIHILHRELGFTGPVGTLFNMSVGYNLEGIQQPNVQWFLQQMQDCTTDLAKAKAMIRSVYPAIDQVDIPVRISNNVTLSTMHGCPPDEIEKIGLYLIRDKKLHTTVKLNPTLLGSEQLRDILNRQLKFATEVPDLAFEHDLKFYDAMKIIRSLQEESARNGLNFSIKLTNTLETVNNREVFDPAEKMMYLSGRALHPISINLARKLQQEMGGDLDISFSAGADCFNISEIVTCGMKPVTVCSDLLKPGGYGRLFQYLENLQDAFQKQHAVNIEEYIIHTAGIGTGAAASALHNLNQYADMVAANPAYHKKQFSEPSIKTDRSLGWFDCIHAPCIDTCPTNQDIPEYMLHTANGDLPAAFEAIFRTNPFPSVTGMVCDHLCQFRCTRINYDESLNIREIKRFVAESDLAVLSRQQTPVKDTGKRVAIIGAGPAGLSCGWFLRQAGLEVDIYEEKNLAGGMISAAIPAFRLTSEAIEKDIRRILASGIKLHDQHKVDGERFQQLLHDYDAVFVGAGAQKSVPLKMDGVESAGVLDPLQFLFKVRKGEPAGSGRHVIIVGGGNTAMDAARTARRLVGPDGTVTIVYRRTIREMPADKGEIDAVIHEGIRIMELVNPVKINTESGRVTGVSCTRNVLSLKGKDGRMVPIAVPDSEFVIPCDTLIPAIGQQLDLDFLDAWMISTEAGSYHTKIEKLYVGGDALRGASTAINAIGDGRKAAAEIIHDLGLPVHHHKLVMQHPEDLPALIHRKSLRSFGFHPQELPLENRENFTPVTSSLKADEASKEAARCLQCDRVCNVCVSVCPNLANFSYTIDPVRYNLEKAVLNPDGKIAMEADACFVVDQPFQVLNIRDFCNECGNCTTFCPSNGQPFSEKPGLCLSVQSLNREGAGFYLSRLPEKLVLIYKEQASIRTLALAGDTYIYETNQVKAVIDPNTFKLIDVRFLTPCVKEFHFEFAAEMSIILKGAIQLGIS